MNKEHRIKQIKNQILVGIKENKIDHTWGMLIVENCNKALNLYVVVVNEVELCVHEWKRNPIMLDRDYCNKCTETRGRK